jgi:hypothetical protein
MTQIFHLRTCASPLALSGTVASVAPSAMVAPARADAWWVEQHRKCDRRLEAILRCATTFNCIDPPCTSGTFGCTMLSLKGSFVGHRNGELGHLGLVVRDLIAERRSGRPSV